MNKSLCVQSQVTGDIFTNPGAQEKAEDDKYFEAELKSELELFELFIEQTEDEKRFSAELEAEMEVFKLFKIPGEVEEIAYRRAINL